MKQKDGKHKSIHIKHERIQEKQAHWEQGLPWLVTGLANGGVVGTRG